MSDDQSPTTDAPASSALGESETGTSAQTANADIAKLGYEQARDELAQIVSTLEGGRAPLEESMRLWERGEALADHCAAWLDGAQTRIEEAVERREGRTGRTATDA